MLTPMEVDHITALSLSSQTNSSIMDLILYSDRARITRAFQASIANGQNKISLTMLPNLMDHESLRIEAEGPAIIRGVTSFKTPLSEPHGPSTTVQELQRRRAVARDDLTRAQKVIKSVDAYMDNIDVGTLDISKLGEAMEVYDNTGKTWNEKVQEIQNVIHGLDEDIEIEEAKEEQHSAERRLRSVVVLDLYGHEAVDIDIHLTYTVSHSSWKSAYDVRVDSSEPSSPVDVLYKAIISQKTGEDWIKVPLTLETSQPVFGVELPTLSKWDIALGRTKETARQGKGLGVGGAKRHRRIYQDPDDLAFALRTEAVVTSVGHVNATFRVPGLTTLRTTVLNSAYEPDEDELDEDEERRRENCTVTVASLNLHKDITWTAVPKGNARVHMMAEITNSSEYTFLPGNCDIYVDNSYVAKIDMPGVSPKEVFTCPLGLDPSVRVTYHPSSTFVSTSGFLGRTTTHSVSQTITVNNTKSVPIQKVKIMEHIPVSNDDGIIVKLVKPLLPMPPPPNSNYSVTNLDKPVAVQEGVVAQWSSDGASKGKDGKLEWVCEMDAFQKVNLVLQWEVSYSQAKGTLDGL